MPNKYDMPALEAPGAGKHGNGAERRIGYKLEVRTTRSRVVIKEADWVIDHVWREVPIRPAAEQWGCNIPIGSSDVDMLRRVGAVSHVVAEAHRWALLAWLDATDLVGSWGIETRLVKIEYMLSYETHEKGVSEAYTHKQTTPAELFQPRPPFVNRVDPPPQAMAHASSVAEAVGDEDNDC